MRIHVVGASGAGTTTLGMALARQLGLTYFDSDAYFWEATEPPFILRRAAAVRNEQFLADAARAPDGWVLGGSVLDWGLPAALGLDLVVFLWVPPALRLARLAARELTRYSPAALAEPARRARYNAFLVWAAGYDKPAPDGARRPGRTLRHHEQWLRTLDCPVLEIRGDTSPADRLARVMRELRRLAVGTERAGG